MLTGGSSASTPRPIIPPLQSLDFPWMSAHQIVHASPAPKQPTHASPRTRAFPGLFRSLAASVLTVWKVCRLCRPCCEPVCLYHHAVLTASLLKFSRFMETFCFLELAYFAVSLLHILDAGRSSIPSSSSKFLICGVNSGQGPRGHEHVVRSGTFTH